MNYVELGNFRVGNGIEIKRLYVFFYPDALLLKRRVEAVKAFGVRIDVPTIERDFASRPQRKGPEPLRRVSRYPILSVGVVQFYDLLLSPTDSFHMRVKAGRFSYSMGGPYLNLSRILLKEIALESDTALSLKEVVGDLVMRYETTYVRLSLSGEYSNMSFITRDGRITLYPRDEGMVLHYRGSLFQLEDKAFSLELGDMNVNWRFKNSPGTLSFRVHRLTYADTLTVEDLSGTLILNSFPKVVGRNVNGRAYGGRFVLSFSYDPQSVLRGDIRVFSVSPLKGWRVTGDAVFSLSPKDSFLIAGGSISYLTSPYLNLKSMNFSFESKNLHRYDFNILGEFVDVWGYYDIPREEGELNFNLNKPLTGISYGGVSVYTFQTEGTVRKRRDILDLSIPYLKIWFITYDTVRIDSLDLKRLKARINLKDLRNSYVEGFLTAHYSQRDTLSLGADYMYSPDSFLLSGEVISYKVGKVRFAAFGRVPDSVLIDSLIYEKGSLNFALRKILLLNRENYEIIIPQNHILGGIFEGYIRLSEDSLEFLEDSKITVTGVNPTPLFGAFTQSMDILVDSLDLTVLLSGKINSPEVKGTLEVKNLYYGDIGIDSLRGEFLLGREVLGVENMDIWIDSVPVLIDVALFYPLNSTIYVFVEGEGVPTDRFLPFLLPDSSAATFQIAVSGNVESPKVRGQLYWTAKSLDLNGNLVKRPSLHMVGYGDKIVLPESRDTNSAKLRKGEVRFWGSIGTNLQIDSLMVELDGAQIQVDPDVTATLSGLLKVVGNLKESIMVTGDLMAEEVEFFKPLTEMAGGTSGGGSNSKPIILYDIHIYAPRRIFLNSTLSSQALTGVLLEIDAELSADLNLQKLGPTFSSVSGSLSFLRGRVYVVDKVFNVDRGEIVLFGNGGTVSILSSATFPRTLQGGQSDSVKVFVSIEGNLERPEVRVWSQPYMATGDILALIVGGGNVLGLLSRGLRWGLNFSEFSIMQTPGSYQLLFGTYITRKIYIKSSLSTTGDYNSIRTLYFVNPNLSIYGERIQDDKGTRYGVGLNLRVRF
ncbi:MAG: hypothetical protein GXO39_07230 [Thermotogae bacterium]|nr:hypothetical protein [Thermotogota bacterium]